jgi:hypothetical protein
MRHDRTFLCEAFNVFCFLRQIAQRDEKREIGILVTGGFEHRVERALHVFPDAVSHGLMTMHPRTSEFSASSAARTTC